MVIKTFVPFLYVDLSSTYKKGTTVFSLANKGLKALHSEIRSKERAKETIIWTKFPFKFRPFEEQSV